MKRVWHTSVKVLAGLFLVAMYAMPQAYTISARPGAVNYIEGHAAINGSEISQKTLGKTFLNANDTLSTDIGKVEVLLTPGVFLRIGNNSEVRMISPSLTSTQIEVTKGEAMIEVADLVKDNNIDVLDHGATLHIDKVGLYRVTAEPPGAAVLEGKADLTVGDRKIELGKGHEVAIAADAKVEKFNTKKEDDLYAWSNVRSEYDAGASYSAARNVTTVSSGYGYGGWGDPYGAFGYGGLGYGYAGLYGGPGWYWNGGWNSWAWLPGNGYFFSPFGWGFYSPAYIGYAPVVYLPVGGRTTAVPISTKNPPAVASSAVRSPAALSAARAQTAQAIANGRVAGNSRVSSGPVAASRASSGGHMSGFSAVSAAPSGGGHAGGGAHR